VYWAPKDSVDFLSLRPRLRVRRAGEEGAFVNCKKRSL
jgi:hypothetical protein